MTGVIHGWVRSGCFRGLRRVTCYTLTQGPCHYGGASPEDLVMPAKHWNPRSHGSACRAQCKCGAGRQPQTGVEEKLSGRIESCPDQSNSGQTLGDELSEEKRTRVIEY